MAKLPGLGFSNTLSAALIPTISFTPTIGIAAARIDKLGLDIRSFHEPLKRAVKEVMIPSIRRNFDEGGRPAWDSLADDTIRQKKFYGYDDRPLIKTGSLRRVATQLNIWDISRTAAVVRDLPDKVGYGKVHQAGVAGTGPAPVADLGKKLDLKLNAALKGKINLKGTGKGTATIPARPFLIIQPEDEQAIEQIFNEWLAMRVVTAWPVGHTGRHTGGV